MGKLQCAFVYPDTFDFRL